MRRLLLLAGLAGCTASPATDPSPSLALGSPQAQAYIVTLARGANPNEIAHAVGVQPRFVYRHALTGFAATLPEAALNGLRNHPAVQAIEPDGIVSITETQSNPPSWGLDRIDQRSLPLNFSYTYLHNGAGVRAYILDSGIRMTHEEFGGRAVSGWDFIDNDPDASDCHGHGSHVAGTVGGSSVGVAKGVTLVSVRVLGCTGSGSISQVVAGIDWVTGNAVAPAVANMSLGGGFSQALNDAVTASIAAGVVYAVSAGNTGTDACQRSPASTPTALTVGATDQADNRASFSSVGTCVDLFAPGVAILSVEAKCATETCLGSKNGTSMASPHVAGVAAIYRALNPGASASQTAQAILDFATVGVVDNPGTGSPNRLLYSLISGIPPPPPPPPPPPSTSMHVGDLDASFQWLVIGKGKTLSNYWGTWAVEIHGADHAPLRGALVTVRYGFANDLSTFTCTTGSTGRCGIGVSGKTKTRRGMWEATIQAVFLSGVPYQVGANHDPDGDSDGVRIVVPGGQ